MRYDNEKSLILPRAPGRRPEAEKVPTRVQCARVALPPWSPSAAEVVSQTPPLAQRLGGHGTTLQGIRKRGVVAHRVCPCQKGHKKKVSDGLSTPGRTGTERVKNRAGKKKSKIKDKNKGQQRWRRWRGGHVGATERLDRRWIDERNASFGVQYSIKFFFS